MSTNSTGPKGHASRAGKLVLLVAAFGSVTLAAETFTQHNQQAPVISATIPGAINPPRSCPAADRIQWGPMAGQCDFPPHNDYGEQPPCQGHKVVIAEERKEDDDRRDRHEESDRTEDQEKRDKVHDLKFNSPGVATCPGTLSSEWDGG